jgi:hypothetical protein
MEVSNNGFENAKAIQFNGWNFDCISEWIEGGDKNYSDFFKNEIQIYDMMLHKNDWVVKNEDGSFSIMSDSEFEELMDKMK